jgi:magnesium transporter
MMGTGRPAAAADPSLTPGASSTRKGRTMAAKTKRRPHKPLPRRRALEGHGTEPEVVVRLVQPGSRECLAIPPDKISDVLNKEGALLWVKVRNPGTAELEMLREEFGFHRLALEDAAKQLQRPKVDEYPGYYFVVIYAPLPCGPDGELHTLEVDLFVGRNYVVSVHRGDLPVLDEATERWERTDPELRTDVGFLLHTVLDTLIDAYFPVVDGIEDRLDALELSLFTGGSSIQPEEILGVKRGLLTLRKAVYPMREVFNTFLRREQTFFSAETFPYFQDVYDHVLRLLDIIDVQRDMATGALDAQLTIVSNRLNETMKGLTVVAICVAIMGAIFGAWGMNFDIIPLAHLANGFWLVSGGTLLLVIAALGWTKWRQLW